VNIYDLTIKNAYIADPEKKTITWGNMGICRNKICIVTKKDISGKHEIDANKKILSPGFIDIHAHIDGDPGCGRLSLIQGVTTTIGGNCGGGMLDIGDFLQSQDRNGFFINQAQFIGHSFVLRDAVGRTDPYTPANSHEISQMEKLLEKCFDEGAIGLSFGLEYAPGSSFEEVIALSKIAARRGRLVSIHTRLSGPEELDSLKEAIDISRITGAQVQISHLVYQYGTGIMKSALEMIDDARRNGINVWADSGMYTNFATGMNTSVYDTEHIRKFGWKYSNMLVASGKHKGEYLTESLYRKMRKSSEDVVIICFTGVEHEIYDALLNKYVIPSSDTGPSPSGNISEGHPQNSGTFPRFFRKMVFEKHYLSLMDAIEKATLIPAEILGFKSKGRVSEGADADLVIFDPETISDRANFHHPDADPIGIDHVIVNGSIAVSNGKIIKGVLSGKTIRRD
jgi:N-acyl-D-amino-acid deacylase